MPDTDQVHVLVTAFHVTYPDLGDAFFQISLEDRNGSPLFSNALTDVPWDLSAFPARFVQWTFDGMTVNGTLTSLVPEPTPVALAALACLLIAGYRRTRT